MDKKEQLKQQIRATYGARATKVAGGQSTGCCSSHVTCDPISSELYDVSEQHAVPEEAFLASLGCGNPTAQAQLNRGEVVLDLGSGGGIDVLLSAHRVGPTGKVYGLDMTDEMLELARENQKRAKVKNVEFLKGEMEDIPLPDASVDVVISNCVINLSSDKGQVFKEIFRVLKPGGRISVSDIVVRGVMPEELRSQVELWIGCIAGALSDTEYRDKLRAAGFEEVSLEPTRIYRLEETREFLLDQGVSIDEVGHLVDGKFMSATVRGRKPLPA